MQLYVVRHAYAGQRGDPNYPDDAERPLTKKGRKRFKALVKQLAKRGLQPELVATSPLVRCRQTAALLCATTPGHPSLVDVAALAPGSDLQALITWTNQQAERSIAWVGHSPDVEQLIGALIGSDAHVRMAKGAIASIDFDGEVTPGQGVLQWLVTPKVLGA